MLFDIEFGRNFKRGSDIGESRQPWAGVCLGPINLERRHVERPIFRNFKIANIKITKDELFDSFIFEFNFSFFRNHLNTQNI